MIKYKNYGEKIILLGTVHNEKECLDYVKYLIRNKKFDYYLLELNYWNYNFILKNKFYFSEFYPIITDKNIPFEKIKLIDMSIEQELKNTEINDSNFFINYLNLKLDLFLYYKLKNSLNDKDYLFQNSKIFNKIVIKNINNREDYMINNIQKYIDHKILIIVGQNHFHKIEQYLNK